MKANRNLSLFSLLLFLAAPAWAQSTGQSAAEMTGREIALLEFFGGGAPLSAAEKQEASRIVESAMLTAPQVWLRLDASGAKSLRQLQVDPAYAGELRASGRLSVELGKSADPSMNAVAEAEARIIKAHDPVVFFDRAAGILVTEQTLRALRNASEWTAKMFQIPAPDADFLDSVRDASRTRFSTVFDRIAADGLAHIERDFPYAVKFFDQAGPQQTEAFFRNNRPHMVDLPDRKATELNLAKAAAVISQTGYNNLSGQRQAGNGKTASALHSLWNRQMQQNVWSIGHPECGPIGDHPSSCGEAPILKPIPTR